MGSYVPSPREGSESDSLSVVLTLCDPVDSTVHGILQARKPEWVEFPSSGDLPNPAIEPRSPTLQVDSLPAELQGKPSTLNKISSVLKQRDLFSLLGFDW